MSEPPEKDPPEPPISSTLRHVKAVQGEQDVDVSWTNLHDKIVRWVAEATMGTNMPPDKSLDDLTQDVMLQVFRDIGEFQVEPGAYCP